MLARKWEASGRTHGREQFVREVWPLGDEVGGAIEVLEVNVLDEEVRERLLRERLRRVLQEELELLERRTRLVAHVHERQVVKRDRVELLDCTRRHVRQRHTRLIHVAHLPLDRCLQVEHLHERRFMQSDRVPCKLI